MTRMKKTSFLSFDKILIDSLHKVKNKNKKNE